MMLGVSNMGVVALMNICVSIGCIVLSWFLLRHVKIELILRVKSEAQIRLFQLFLAILCGHVLSSFLLQYMSWSGFLGLIFR